MQVGTRRPGSVDMAPEGAAPKGLRHLAGGRRWRSTDRSLGAATGSPWSCSPGNWSASPPAASRHRRPSRCGSVASAGTPGAKPVPDHAQHRTDAVKMSRVPLQIGPCPSGHMTVRRVTRPQDCSNHWDWRSSLSERINDKPIQPTATASGIWDPTIRGAAPARPPSSIRIDAPRGRTPDR
jgi:hypothetical protein